MLGAGAYDDVIADVISAYWRDYEDHKNEFMPAFLANDILRMWRTFCVNYEARTQSEPPERKAKRKLKNYKLKHSRLLTCYSALLYLLAIFHDKHTVSPADTAAMIKLTPTRRLEWLASQSNLAEARPKIDELLKCYEEFLDNTSHPEAELVQRFMEKEQSKRYFESANRFGDLVFEVLDAVGRKNRFHRLIVV